MSDSFSASARWFYGSSYGLTLAFSMDPTKSSYPVHVGPELPAPAIRDDAEQRHALALLLDHRTQTFADRSQLRDISLRQSLQGEGGVYFCGAHFGAGFHEDAVQAGLAVAEQIGGVRRPWTVPDESGRIVLVPQPAPQAVAA